MYADYHYHYYQNLFVACFFYDLYFVLQDKLNKEERATRFNLNKLNHQWRNIMREAKSRELKKDIEILSQTFERVIDRKVIHSHETNPSLLHPISNFGRVSESVYCVSVHLCVYVSLCLSSDSCLIIELCYR